jgi:hypothetical protein
MRSTEEIAAEIIDEIRKANPAAEISEIFVHRLIGRLKWPSMRDPKIGNRKQNKRYAEEVIKWIEDGHRLLAGRPDTFDSALPFGELSIYYDPSLVPVVPVSAGERARSLKDILAGIRRQAKFIIDNEIGAHGNSGQDQKLAAELALGLVATYGLPATYSSENSVYCKVARLCLEAITGRSSENAEDIRRACRVVPQEHPAVELGEPSLALTSAWLQITASMLREVRKRGLIQADLVFGRIGTEIASGE